MKEYWDEQHFLQNRKFLTGTTLQQYCELFGITAEFLKGKTVLEIGVGLGIATKELSLIVANLDVLDISTIALNNVKAYVRHGYADVKKLPKECYDVVISHLVAQHMNDSDLIIQLENVIKALSRNGIIYIQWADAYLHNLPVNYDVEKGGGVLRTIDDMDKVVKYAGGDLKIIAVKGVTSAVTWYGGTIRRK